LNNIHIPYWKLKYVDITPIKNNKQVAHKPPACSIRKETERSLSSDEITAAAIGHVGGILAGERYI
jgi:hypothetical protein